MKYISLLLILLSLMVWNCNDDKNSKSSVEFKTSKRYSALQVNYNKDKLLIGSPSFIIYIDSAFVFLSPKTTNFITILDLKNNNILELGIKGKGPGELIMPFSLRQRSENNFEVFDAAKKYIFKYDIDSCRHGRTNPIKAFQVAKGSFRCYSISDSLFLNNGLFDNQFAFKISDINKKDLVQFGGYNFNPDDNNSPMNKFMAYQGNTAVQDTNFVWACAYAPIIEIFSFRENNKVVLKKSIIQNFVDYVPEHNSSAYSSALKNTNKFAYFDIATTSDRIYLLYSGKLSNKHSSDFIMCSEIHVLDWDGNFLEKMILDKEVVNIAISKGDQRLYAITHDPEPQIVYFQL